MKSKCFDYTMLTLVIIGAINWGLIGFFKFDLVAFLCGLYLISLFGRISAFGEE